VGRSGGKMKGIEERGQRKSKKKRKNRVKSPVIKSGNLNVGGPACRRSSGKFGTKIKKAD